MLFLKKDARVLLPKTTAYFGKYWLLLLEKISSLLGWVKKVTSPFISVQKCIGADSHCREFKGLHVRLVVLCYVFDFMHYRGPSYGPFDTRQ